MQKKILTLVSSAAFERTIIGLILLNALILGLETNAQLMQQYGEWFTLCQHIILVAFIVEAGLKIASVAPHINRYFSNGWNLFDFSIIILSLVPATGELAMISRLARLLRVLRLISSIPELRLIVTTLMRSISSMGYIMLLMSIIFYIYAVAGYHLFSIHDPQHWGNLGTSVLTLFRIVTLEDWTDLMYTAQQLYPWAWIYFISFIFVGTFVIVNLFIAVVVNNLEKTKAEEQQQAVSVSREDLLKEFKDMQCALAKLEQSIKKLD